MHTAPTRSARPRQHHARRPSCDASSRYGRTRLVVCVSWASLVRTHRCLARPSPRVAGIRHTTPVSTHTPPTSPPPRPSTSFATSRAVCTAMTAYGSYDVVVVRGTDGVYGVYRGSCSPAPSARFLTPVLCTVTASYGFI